MKTLLQQINSPTDLKKLSMQELEQLTTEIRTQMLTRLSVTGGHVGSNLGMIETTTALHYVFNSPVDKFVFDVSHQCYTHKLLTGRKEAYTDPKQYDKVTGFTNPLESEHDLFAVGHTSTAISLACGLAKARNLQKANYQIIAVTGDGALSGGLAFEGLNNAATLHGPLMIVINDNQMSIAENHGGIYQNLQLLRNTQGKAECNLFKAMGFDYYFVQDGHNLNELIDVFSKVKQISHPVIVHVCTTKGKGYLFAEEEKEKWHYMAPFHQENGLTLAKPNTYETYENLTRDYLIAKMKKDKSIVAITAGTPKIFGFDKKLRDEFPEQFVDVGIAEGHAVSFVSGIAKNGGKPVFGVSSSFLQRAYDQLSHDLALNKSPAVILVYFSGISSGNQTHMGIFDIPLTMNIPNLTCLAPSCKEEYLDMLEWALEQTDGPVIIRVPGIQTLSRKVELLTDYSNQVKYETVISGNQVAILALGNFYQLGKDVQAYLNKAYNIEASLINPRYITGYDKVTLEKLKENHQLVVTLENGQIDGGFGEKIARYYGTSQMKVLNLGAEKAFIDNLSVQTQYQRFHLTVPQIAENILKVLQGLD